ncbi:MAG: hypothetical protein AAGG44_11745 [Planctomycetota bacterium]
MKIACAKRATYPTLQDAEPNISGFQAKFSDISSDTICKKT